MLVNRTNINYIIIKSKALVIYLGGFATDLFGLFCWIWVKTNFPLYNPFVDLRKIAIQ